jgi:flagellar M-ring protein FliF
LKGLIQVLRNMGVVRVAVLAAVAALSILFFGFITTRMTAPGMGLLFSDLDAKDSGEIVQKLETMNISYELRGQGTTIMVPIDQVTRLRMVLADDGLPHGGSVGYEIFDKSDAFGTSTFVENVNEVRALEGELARTISSLSLIAEARVHLVLPQRELFTRERQEPSASIVVKMRGAERLNAHQVAAIQHLVASAVPNLTPARVSIVDTDGNLLAPGVGDGDALAANSSTEMRIDYENHVARKVEELLDRTVGPGKSRVDVHVDMNLDRVTTSSESFDPNGQVVRSTQTVTDQNDSSQGSAGAQPISVTTAIPGGAPANGAAGAASAGNTTRSRESRDEETTNYEISKTTRNQVSEAGQVVRQSVAVLVDGSYTTNPDGTKKYQPRSADELKQLTELVRSAIGYDGKRGDVVDVVNMQFAPVDLPAATAAPGGIMGLDKSEIMRMAETLILAVVSVLVILLVIRPIVNRLLDSAVAGGPGEIGRLLGGPGAAPALPAPGGHGTAVARAMQVNDQGEMIDMSQVEGRVAQSAVKKVAEIVEKHPEEALAIVRSWMYQER